MLLRELLKNVGYDELYIYKESIWEDKPYLGRYYYGDKIPKKYLKCFINPDFRIWVSNDNKLVVMVAINWV